MSTILEMRDVRLKRRELYRKMEGMALTQREFTPEETASFEALRQQVEALDERLMALEDQQVAVEEGASRSSRRLTGPVPIGRNVPGQYSQPEGCAQAANRRKRAPEAESRLGRLRFRPELAKHIRQPGQ